MESTFGMQSHNSTLPALELLRASSHVTLCSLMLPLTAYHFQYTYEKCHITVTCDVMPPADLTERCEAKKRGEGFSYGGGLVRCANSEAPSRRAHGPRGIWERFVRTCVLAMLEIHELTKSSPS